MILLYISILTRHNLLSRPNTMRHELGFDGAGTFTFYDNNLIMS